MQKQLHIQFLSTSLFRESAFQSILTIKTYLSAILISHQHFYLHLFLSLPLLSFPWSHKQPVKSNCVSTFPCMFTSHPVDPTIIIPWIKHHNTTITSCNHRFSQALVWDYIGQCVCLAWPVTSNVHPRATLCSQQICQRALYEVTVCHGQCWPWLTLYLAFKETVPLQKEICDALPAIQLCPNVPL